MLRHPSRHKKTQTKVKFVPLKCQYYGKYGHIKHYYYRLCGYPKYPTKSRSNHVKIKTRQEWKLKVVETSFIAHIS